MIPAPEEAVTVRVTLAQVVTGLTAHHLLQQVIGSAILPCTRGPLPTLILSYHPSPAPLPLPSLLLPSLLLSLRTSHRAAYAFDSRPGLKFLLQKVVQNLNLYNSHCTIYRWLRSHRQGISINNQQLLGVCAFLPSLTWLPGRLREEGLKFRGWCTGEA